MQICCAPLLALSTIAAGLGACAPDSRGVSGVVEVDRTFVNAQVSGTLTAVSVREGDEVAGGDVIATVDCDAARLHLEAANAAVRQAAARLAMLEAGATDEEVEAARAQAQIAAAQLTMGRRGASPTELEQLDAAIAAVDAKRKLAAQSVARVVELTQGGVGTPAQLDAARAELAALEAELQRLRAQRTQARTGARVEERAILEEQLNQARARLKQVEKGARTEELAMASAAVDGARAQFELAQTHVDHCEIRTPVAGRVDVVNFRPGELVAVGAPIASIVDASAFRFRAFARQEQLGRLDVGSRASVRIDGYPTAPLPARVTRIFDTPEFTAGNVQTSDDRMLLVFRVDLDLEPRAEVPLRPGMTGIVDFSTSGAAP